jgi:Amt family ammonium transporter
VAFVALGTGLLWFGWFGFNSGDGYAASGFAAQAFVNTDIAGSIAMCTWLAITWWHDGKPSLVGALTGAVAGLACVTPCAGYVPTWASFIIGVGAGSLCYYAVIFKSRMQWDDALDVWAAHGVGGTLGIILLGVFATYAVNPTGGQGLITGHFHFFAWQLITAVVVATYAFVATYLILKLLNLFGSVRVPDSEQLKGLDETEFGEAAYDLI